MKRADLNSAAPPPLTLTAQRPPRSNVANRVYQLGQSSVLKAKSPAASALKNVKKPSIPISLPILMGEVESNYSSFAELLVDEQLLFFKSLYEDIRVQLAKGQRQKGGKSSAEIKFIFWGINNYLLLVLYYPLCRARFYGKFYWEFAGTEPTAYLQVFQDTHLIKEKSLAYVRKAIENIEELNTLNIPLKNLQARCTILEEIFKKEGDFSTTSMNESFILINHWAILQRRCQAFLFSLKNFGNIPFSQKEKWGKLINQEVEKCWQAWMTEAEEWQKILNSERQGEWDLNDFVGFMRSFEQSCCSIW